MKFFSPDYGLGGYDLGLAEILYSFFRLKNFSELYFIFIILLLKRENANSHLSRWLPVKLFLKYVYNQDL